MNLPSVKGTNIGACLDGSEVAASQGNWRRCDTGSQYNVRWHVQLQYHPRDTRATSVPS